MVEQLDAEMRRLHLFTALTARGAIGRGGMQLSFLSMSLCWRLKLVPGSDQVKCPLINRKPSVKEFLCEPED